MQPHYQPLNDLNPLLTTFTGDRILLRPLTADDFTAAYIGWFRDHEATRFLEARDISAEDAEQHLADGLRSGQWAMLAIISRAEGKHIGNVKVGPINWEHGVADLVTVIGERPAWGKGYASEAIQLAGDASFECLGLRKLSGAVIEGNHGSIRAYAKAGWEIEGRLKAHVLVDGEARDKILISRFNPEYFDT